MAMLFLTLLVFGWRSYQQLPINLMPDISYPTLTVRTEYEGGAPEDVEKLVTRPLEEMLSIVSGMVEISSVSSAGLSEIILEFTWDTDMNVAQQDVRDRLDLFDPPKEVTEKPVILRYDPTLDPVMRVAITPKMLLSGSAAERQALTEIRDSAERHLKSDLEAEMGIAQVAVKGGQEEEIQILVDAQQLKSMGLSLDYIVNSLAQQNINLSGGSLKEGKTEYLVRTLNEFEDVEEIRQSIITTASGRQLPLQSVAEVFTGAKERETVVRINGREAVALDIFKEGDANTVQVCNKLKDLLGFEREPGVVEKLKQMAEEAQRKAREARGEVVEEDAETEVRDQAAKRTMLDRLPRDIELTIISDQSRFIQGSINEVQDATVVGGLLALMILFLFLRELKATLIIGIAIPISVVATFIPMFAREISLNIMSLGGLALGVGMLVDNSIVVLESIFRCKEEGDGVLDAAERGTKEVGSAVTASTLTTICVFLPIAFVEGIAGQLFSDLALTVTFSLLASLLAALYLIPLIASRRGLALAADREVVWLLRAYREGRAEEKGRFSSLLGILPRSFGYMVKAFLSLTKDTFGPTVATWRAVLKKQSLGNILAAIASIPIFLFLIVLYFCQLALRLIAACATTLLFLVALLFFSVIVVVSFILRTLLRFPLWLFNATFDLFRDAYGFVLHHSLRFSAIILLLIMGLAAHAFYTARDLGMELIPPMDQGEFGIRMEAKAGTRLEQTETQAKKIETLIRAVPQVASVTVEVGKEKSSSGSSDRGENVAEFTVLLNNPKQNAFLQESIIDALRQEIRMVSADEITFTLPSLFSFNTAVEVQIVGDDLAELKRVGKRALEAVSTVPGLFDTELSVKEGYPEIIVKPDREKLASKGIALSQIGSRLRTEVQGEVPTRFNRAGEKVDIRVRTNQRQLNSVSDLEQLAVTDGDKPIPLRDVAQIIKQDGPSEIRRIDQRQVVLITANVEGRDLRSVSQNIRESLRNVDRPDDYYFVLGGQNRELETSYGSLRFALLLAIFLVYVVMACQFESILHPALVMFSVPLAFIGVIYALYFTHTDLSIMVFLGGIVLAGIVVNDAIVLVDYVNQLRARGYPKHKALVEAGKVRLRPIIMTTVTTVLGLLPMILSSGEGAEMRRPMALTVMAGLTSATILTLLIIPMAYNLFGGRDKTDVEQGTQS